MAKKFINAIKDNVELGISVAVSVRDFNEIPSLPKELIGRDAHYLAFKSVVLAMMTHLSHEPGSCIHFTCDEDEGTTLPCYKWYKDIKREMPIMRAHLASFCVADDRHFPQLQASDLFAGLNRAEANRRLNGEISETQDLFTVLTEPTSTSRLKFKALYLDRSVLSGLVAELQDGITRVMRAD